MKKSILFMTAVATAIGFAACSGGGEGTLTKEQADSIANAKADSMANALKAQNDSLIAAQAAEEARRADSARIADSLFAAGKKSGTIISKPTKPNKGGSTKPATPSEGPAPAPKPEEPKTGGLKGQSDQNKSGGGLKSKSDQAKQDAAKTQSGGGLKRQSDQSKQQTQ